MEGFEKAKVAAQLISQAKISQLSTTVDLDVHAISELKDKLNIPLTIDGPKYNYKSLSDNKDSVYSFDNCKGKVLAIRKNKSFVNEVSDTDLVGIILDATNFYAEAGGQECDTGFLVKDSNDNEVEFQVVQVKLFAGYILHIGCLLNNTPEGDKCFSIKVGDVLRLEINQVS